MMKVQDVTKKGRMGLYGAVSGSDIRYDADKGTRADASGTHWLIGAAGKLDRAEDRDVIYRNRLYRGGLGRYRRS